MPTAQYKTPGVYREDVFPAPAVELLTGVPAFIGFAVQGPANTPQRLTVWAQFENAFGPPLPDGYLASAVRGFFENGGSVCYVVRLNQAVNPIVALTQALVALEPLDTIDLVCAPDIMRSPRPGVRPAETDVRTMQLAVLTHCEKQGDRLAILDPLLNATVDEVFKQRRELSGTNGALYYPWIWVSDITAPATEAKVPPCGHVAGVYARSDQGVGVHKAPANEILEGVLDLEVNVTDAEQGLLNPESVNCLRAFPGRGIRVWGARTLSNDPAWTYVNVRRLFLIAGRWIERAMAGVAFEPNEFMLWVRIERELRAYFSALFRQGALKGATEEEAFYVRCDADTNPPEVRDAGMVVTEIGLAPGLPNEFVAVRLIHGASGVIITGPTRPG